MLCLLIDCFVDFLKCANVEMLLDFNGKGSKYLVILQEKK